MTLIIGLRCRDGLIFAADSLSTETSPQGAMGIIKHTSEKLVKTHNVLWGASGSVGVKQLVKEAIETKYNSIYNINHTAVAIRASLVSVIAPIVTTQYRLVHDASGGRGPIPHANFLFGVYTLKDKFSLISIECDMNGEVVESAHASTGSGMKTGQALIGRLRNKDWDLKMGAVVAYRTMNDAIHVEPAGIGPPIRMARCSLDGNSPKVELLTEHQLDEVKTAAETWTTLEQEALGNKQLFSNGADPIPA